APVCWGGRARFSMSTAPPSAVTRRRSGARPTCRCSSPTRKRTSSGSPTPSPSAWAATPRTRATPAWPARRTRSASSCVSSRPRGSTRSSSRACSARSTSCAATSTGSSRRSRPSSASGMPRPLGGQIQTVLGAIERDAIGITLPHEHLLIDFKVMFAEPAAASDKGRAWEPVSLANLGWVRQNFNANLDNLRLLDEQVAQDEISLFKQAGGRTVVDPTPKALAEFVGKEGGALQRTIMCHLCRTITDVQAVIDLAQSGIWLEYDLFGLENSFYPYNPSFDMPNDGGRMVHVLALIAAGHGNQILMSHDIVYKTSLVKYGGYGYHHLLVNVVPRLRARGVDDAGLTRLLVENPARAFAFA